jgi:SAM-dependent methyltransferase
MDKNIFLDVPSPIDLRTMTDARNWEQTAMTKRPWRTEFFEKFASEIDRMPTSFSRILELGSGPGFLAQHLLQALPQIQMVLLDFSAAMHELAMERLGNLANRAKFVERSFKEPGWTTELGQFECIVTNQAVHELRHKCHAPALHSQVREILVPGGIYLVCDHFAGDGGMKNDQLYMSIDEQRQALVSAGFKHIEQIIEKGGLVLHRAS